MKTLLFLLMIACASGASAQEYKQQVQTYLKHYMKDPDSLKQFTVSKPEHADVRIGGRMYHWLSSCVSYNAKNSYGAYEGVKYVLVYYTETGIVANFDREGCDAR